MGDYATQEERSPNAVNPYSHLVIASKVESLIGPTNSEAYHWGAIAPDIRYVADIQRSQTHRSAQQIMALIPHHPHLQSFLKGYLVHCLTDEVDLEAAFHSHVPFSLLKRTFVHQHLAVILEFFYIENVRITASIAGTYNEVLRDLGLSEADCTTFAQFIEHYTTLSSLDGRVAELVQLMGFENNHRVEQYVAAAKRFQKQWLLKNALFLGIRSARISRTLVSQVSDRVQAVLTQDRERPV